MMTPEQKKQAEEALAKQMAAQKAAEEAAAKEAAEFQKMLETPLEEAEARKMLADCDVKLAQLAVVRAKKLDELNQIDLSVRMVTFDRSVVARRALNACKPAEAKS